MSSKNSETPLKDRIDWVTVIVPFLAILALCVCFILMPDASKSVLDTIRFILGDTFGLFYLAVGLFVFLLSLYLAFSRFGTIRLGKPDEKPKLSPLRLGEHDVHLRTRSRYPVLLLL